MKLSVLLLLVNLVICSNIEPSDSDQLVLEETGIISEFPGFQELISSLSEGILTLLKAEEEAAATVTVTGGESGHDEKKSSPDGTELMDEVRGMPTAEDRKHAHRISLTYNYLCDKLQPDHLQLYEDLLGVDSYLEMEFFDNHVATEAFIKLLIHRDCPLLLTSLLETATIDDDEDREEGSEEFVEEMRKLTYLPVRILLHISELDDVTLMEKYFRFFLDVPVPSYFPFFNLVDHIQPQIGLVKNGDFFLFISQAIITYRDNPAKIVDIISSIDNILKDRDPESYESIIDQDYMQLLLSLSTSMEICLRTLLRVAEGFSAESFMTFWENFGHATVTGDSSHYVVFLVMLSFQIDEGKQRDLVDSFFRVFPTDTSVLLMQNISHIPSVVAALRHDFTDLESIAITVAKMVFLLMNDIADRRSAFNAEILIKKLKSVLLWPDFGSISDPSLLSEYYEDLLFRLIKIVDTYNIDLIWSFVMTLVLNVLIEHCGQDFDILVRAFKRYLGDELRLNADFFTLTLTFPEEAFNKLGEIMLTPNPTLFHDVVKVIKKRTFPPIPALPGLFKTSPSFQSRAFITELYEKFGGVEDIFSQLLESEYLDIEALEYIISTAKIEKGFEVVDVVREAKVFEEMMEDEFDGGEPIKVTWAAVRDPSTGCDSKIFLKSF